MLGGEARVQRLRHGAELQLRAARHAESKAERRVHTLAIEPKEPRTGGGSAEYADRRSRVPAALVVHEVDALADPRLYLEAHDVGIEQRVPGGAALLGERENRRRQHCRGVPRGRMEV